MKNNYPEKLIYKLIDDTKKKITYQRTHVNQIQHQTLNNADYFSSITYVPHLSEKLRKCIKTKCPDMKMTFKHNNTIGKTLFSKIKDKNKLQETSNVIYKIPCKDCDKCYIGQTSQKIRNRNYGPKQNQKNYQNSNGSLANHVANTRHSFDFDKTSILDVEKHPYKRLTMEGIHIFLEWENNVNCRDEINGIDHFYSSILKQHYNSNTTFNDSHDNE